MEVDTIIAVDKNGTANVVGHDSSNGVGEHHRPIRREMSFLKGYRMPQRPAKTFTKMQTAMLSFQALGVVYGDLGTSPLYVFNSIILDDLGRDNILGILSLIFWTLTSIALVKYMFIVLLADDNGEGGTFALYSLLRQHVNFKSKMIAESSYTRLDSDLKLKYFAKDSGLRTRALSFLEGSRAAQNFISFIVLVGTCMVIGDGILTPAVSVLSAVQGIQSRSSKITQEYVVGITVAILICLFLFQRFGTSKVGIFFSPIMVIWFLFTATIGVYNVIKYYPSVFKAISPYYIYVFFKRNGSKVWGPLSDIVLCITGAEAMFADMGHFNRRAIQIAFSSLVYPSLILAYSGQAAFLIKNPDKLSTTFYSAIPEPIFWPMFMVATLAAIVASQSLISASFSIIRQSIALGCFPRVSFTHTSGKHEGQVYSPEVNYLLMILCVLVTVAFKGGSEIGNAFGVAVIWVMLITTALMVVVMLVIWNTNPFLVAVFFLFFAGLEGMYMITLLHKIPHGGWVPFAISAFFLAVTLSWTYGRRKKSDYESVHKVSTADFHRLAAGSRVPGLCFFCTDLVNGIPPIVRHYAQHVGSLREVMVLVTIRILPVRSVLPEERFSVARLGPAAPTGLYRCLVQYGYMDEHSLDGEEFVQAAVAAMREVTESEEEAALLESAARGGVIFVLGRVILKKKEKSNLIEHLMIDNFYRFLQKNFRSNVATLKIPPGRILQVGMQYEV